MLLKCDIIYQNIAIIVFQKPIIYTRYFNIIRKGISNREMGKINTKTKQESFTKPAFCHHVYCGNGAQIKV